MLKRATFASDRSFYFQSHESVFFRVHNFGSLSVFSILKSVFYLFQFHTFRKKNWAKDRAYQQPGNFLIIFWNFFAMKSINTFCNGGPERRKDICFGLYPFLSDISRTFINNNQKLCYLYKNLFFDQLKVI